MQEHRGPDALLPAETMVTWIRDQPVKLRMGKKGIAAEKPVSVPTMLHDIACRIPDAQALAVKRNDKWVTWSYSLYLQEIRTAAKAFIRLGLSPLKGVGILGFNSPEWFISGLGAIYAGGLCTGIYTTNSPEAVEYVAKNAECNILVVEDDFQLQKVLQIRENLPHLTAIVQYSGQLTQPYPNVYTWGEFLEKANEVMDEELENRLHQQAPNRCCMLVYTSGTTGNPKGVMLSHDNVIWTAKCLLQKIRLEFGVGRIISYLPLSHIAGQILDVYAAIMAGSSVYFAQPDALKGSLLTTLKEVRPTLFLGVPRVWEKFAESMKAAGKAVTGFRQMVSTWARGLSREKYEAACQGRNTQPWGWWLANILVFRKVKDALGLDEGNLLITGAAPISRDVMDFFASFDMPLMEVYGMSESTGPQTINVPWSMCQGTVGKTLEGCMTKLDQPNSEGQGEVCMSGRNVFMGYLNMEDMTHEALGESGLLHSGDLGVVDEEGFLTITGRLKEILITAGGENVAPVPIEDRVKEELPCISNCMLIGDKHKFLSILLAFKTEVDPNTMEPQDQLTSLALDWCKEKGSDITTVTQLRESKDPQVWKAIQAGIERANDKAISRAQKIQKWTILPQDFSIPGGELGPTLKLKRPVVLVKYADTIEELYADPSQL